MVLSKERLVDIRERLAAENRLSPWWMGAVRDLLEERDWLAAEVDVLRGLALKLTAGSPPETDAEVDAYLRAEGLDPDKIAADGRAFAARKLQELLAKCPALASGEVIE